MNGHKSTAPTTTNTKSYYQDTSSNRSEHHRPSIQIVSDTSDEEYQLDNRAPASTCSSPAFNAAGIGHPGRSNTNLRSGPVSPAGSTTSPAAARSELFFPLISEHQMSATSPRNAGPPNQNTGYLIPSQLTGERQKSGRSGQGYGQARPEGPGICGLILTLLSYVLVLITFPVSLCLCIKVVQEYERAVIFRLGRLLPGGAVGPGIFFVLPCIDSYRKVDMRTVSFDVPPQEILSKDSVTVAVDAVVYYRVSNATISVTNVEDAARSTRLLAATTLRNVLGTKTLGEVLAERESISHLMQSVLDDATDPWGVKVERVEIKDVRLPVQLQRAMAAEAEAAREARAKVIAAEGEQRAARALKEAAEIIHESPAALQLRYLQTLNTISAEKNSTIVFPLPIDLISSFFNPNNSSSHHYPPEVKV